MTVKTARELMGSEFPSWVDDEPGTWSVEWLLEEVAERARAEMRDAAAGVVDATATEAARSLEAERKTIAARLDEAVGLLRRAHAVIEPRTYNDSTVCLDDIDAFLTAIDAEKAREGT